MCKNNVISVTVPNVTGVPNVTSSQMYRKCPKIILCAKNVPKSNYVNLLVQCTNWCTKRHMHENAPNVPKLIRDYVQRVKNSVTSVDVPNVTGVPNVTSNPNVPKMTQNHYNLPKNVPNRYQVYQLGVLNVTCSKIHRMQQNALGVIGVGATIRAIGKK